MQAMAAEASEVVMAVMEHHEGVVEEATVGTSRGEDGVVGSERPYPVSMLSVLSPSRGSQVASAGR